MSDEGSTSEVLQQDPVEAFRMEPWEQKHWDKAIYRAAEIIEKLAMGEGVEEDEQNLVLWVENPKSRSEIAKHILDTAQAQKVRVQKVELGEWANWSEITGKVWYGDKKIQLLLVTDDFPETSDEETTNYNRIEAHQKMELISFNNPNVGFIFLNKGLPEAIIKYEDIRGPEGDRIYYVNQRREH